MKGFILKKIKLIAGISFIICLIFQIGTIFHYWGFTQNSDWGDYINIAKQTYNENCFYPTVNNLYDSYIWAPGFINILICLLSFFHNVYSAMIMNMIMNIIITLEIFYLAKKFFNSNTAYIAIIIYSLLYSNWTIVAPIGTEVPFLFFSLTGLCLSLSTQTHKLILSGICLALANWIRPLIIIFLPAILFYMLRNKRSFIQYIYLIFSIIVTITIIGLSNKNRMGEFVFQSTTGGANLIMAANDNAKVGINQDIFTDPTNIAYIKYPQELTFSQKDKLYKERALNWLVQNPQKYSFVYFQKLFRLYISDSWTDFPLQGPDALSGGFLKEIVDNGLLSKVFIFRFLKSFIYYLCISCFIYTIIIKRKDIFSTKGVFFLSIILIGTFFTCIFPAATRYHYPFMFCIVIWAAYGIEEYLTKRIK